MNRLALFSIALGLVAGAAQSDTIHIIGAELPPMMMGSGEGREAEIISSTLARCGHEVTWEIQPFRRHLASYESGKGDAVTTVPVGMTVPGTHTGVYFHYQNGVSTLATHPAVTSLEDLAGETVVAFQGASETLAPLAEAEGSFASYREITDQKVHSQLLFSGRADAVVGDGMVFAEYNRQLAENVGRYVFDLSQPVVFKAIFEPLSFVMVFRDARLAADFDRCFAESEADGTIAAINTAWADRYRDVLGDQYIGY
ncbi:MAG: ABC transporter substrate-binding protein [Rhodobacterales bacterium]|nr:MAG: ABC transporter substrate-binding protein [Rhodobacterales bacterium]